MWEVRVGGREREGEERGCEGREVWSCEGRERERGCEGRESVKL